MFAIEIQHVFHAGHQLRLVDGSLEPYHEHDWHVAVRVLARQLDELETVLDFHTVEQALQSICADYAGKRLNEVAPFQERGRNPSAERVAERIAELLGPKIESLAAGETGGATRFRAWLAEVRVTEAAGCLAIWIGESQTPEYRS
ncbi:MAG: 6-carboxytetrahydropterin synthase [Phycisphaerae bacterium]